MSLNCCPVGGSFQPFPLEIILVSCPLLTLSSGRKYGKSSGDTHGPAGGAPHGYPLMNPLDASLPMYWKNVEPTGTSWKVRVVWLSLKPAALDTILES